MAKVPPSEVRRSTSTSANAITTSQGALRMCIGCARRGKNDSTTTASPRGHESVLLHERIHRMFLHLAVFRLYRIELDDRSCEVSADEDADFDIDSARRMTFRTTRQ